MKNTDNMHPTVFNALHTTNKVDLEDLYKVWAESYDRDVVEVIGYVGHSITTELLLKYVDNFKAKILDAGCGTGLVGEILHEKKYKNIVGIDFSQPMLNQALEKNVYQSLGLADLTEKFTFKDNTFDAIVCAGTFTCGHVGPEALLEMVRVTKTGGYISFTVRDQEWDLLPYEQTIKELEDKNLWRCMERLTTKYNLDEGVSCQLCLYEVIA